MDIELARTFLKVIETGSFIHAAEQLFVTQAAVSRRMKTLETDLDCRLFVRNKSGATLTLAGKRFRKHAVKLVQTLEHARHEVGVSRPYENFLAVGARFGLWDGLLTRWLSLIRQREPKIVIHAKVGFEPELMQQLIDGHLDIGVMYTPNIRPGLEIKPLLVEELILVTSNPNKTADVSSYVHVDWGPEFNAQYKLNLPAFSNPGVIATIGWLAIQKILQTEGSAYLPTRLATPYLKNQKLHEVADAPTFKLPAYVVYPADRDPALFDSALALIHQVAQTLN